MKYNKPIITIDNGLAEGVYAASGANGNFSVKYLSTNIYYQDNGAKIFQASWDNMNIQSITLTFNMKVDSASANTGVAVNGSTVTLTYSDWNPTSPIDITVVRSSNIQQLELTGFSHTEK